MSKRSRQHGTAPLPAAAPAAPPATLCVLALFAAALASYWISLAHPLVFDDRLLRDDFLQLYGSSGFRLDLRWLSYASFGWTYDVVGRQWPWHRLLNILLHAATATLLFSFLARLFAALLPAPAAGGGAGTRWIAFFGALIFLLHPAAAYGVAYLVQRPIVLATLFSLLALRLFLEGLLTPSRSWYYAAAAAYFAAVFSKEHAVMLPAVAAALAVLVRGRSAPLLRELAVPFALFAGIGMLIVLKTRGLLGAPYELAAQELLARLRESGYGPEPPDAYPLSVINQGFLYFRYLLTWLAPAPGWMAVDVRAPFPTGFLHWPQAAGFAAWVAYPVCAAGLLIRGGRPGLVGLGLLYPWLFALTEVAAVRIQEPFALYRSYLWMSGLPIVLAPALGRVPVRWAIAVLSAVSIALVPPLLGRLDTFSSSIKLWDDAVRKNGGVQALLVERGHHNRGLAYLQAGQYPDALRDFDRALELNARDAVALVGRGTLFARTGSLDRALADLGRAIELDPGYSDAYAKRCFAKMLLEAPRDALPDCEKAVALDRRHRDAHTNLGVVYTALNRAGDAEASYRRALAIEPSNGDANLNYGVLLAALGRTDEARAALARACDAQISSACEMLNALDGSRSPGRRQ